MSYHKRTIRTLSHCFYDLKYHIVWTPKYRGKVLEQPKIKQEVARVINQISSIGLDEHLIRRYVRHQYDKNQLEQPSLFNIFK